MRHRWGKLILQIGKGNEHRHPKRKQVEDGPMVNRVEVVNLTFDTSSVFENYKSSALLKCE